MHSSLALLIKRNKPSSEGSKVELHFNLWDVSTKNYGFAKGRNTFLDVGLYIEDTKNLTDLLIYFPFDIPSDGFIDLHSCFRKDSELVRTIFNENLSFDSVTQSLSFVRFDEGREKKFFIHELPFNNDSLIEIKHGDYQYNGSKIKSTIVNFKKDFFKALARYQLEQREQGRDSPHSYFRFRVPLKKINIFVDEYKQGSAIITGTLHKNEIIDFRFNEVRSLPAQVYQEKDARELEFASCRVDYFLVKDAMCEYQTSHGSFKKSRTLEKSFWKEYLLYENNSSPLKNVLENEEPMVIYHWNKTKDKDGSFVGFSAFSKFIEPRVKKRNVFFYVALIVSLAIVANIVTSYMQSAMPYIFAEAPNENIKNCKEDKLNPQPKSVSEPTPNMVNDKGES
ncbi:hypothetical protein RG677_003670 [Vibrio parahaemolyticus]|uniref:hypothetical protein n=1 Tax=Vibrio parahaemolyticus TaxID=670 RepID=UPI00046FFC96|nr:hypothetical protein [Vibrio parahaemolyticus]EHK0752006.1 hypothetical protein [Vibrio parahaemolyticus]EJB8573611.1 hypothetical protein [Vibrio parahaemolyticus]EJE4176438.1 hypothetical protein [Vibrio parahaemolyticus]ELB2952184.1 hypothetical protein [Vibrio parahaemolyticus]MCR9781340.1 hypothetical protein [Vibrio parahaemolyticus]